MNAQEMTVFQEDTGAEMSPVFHAIGNEGLGQDLTGGVSGSYAIVSIRGSKFRIKMHGDETAITAANGDPVGSLEAVIIKANPHLTKQFYEKGYEEGDSAAPVCFSLDGIAPSPASEKLQHTSCALCPQNKFGSRVTPAGTKVKACQDNRKIAIVPLADIDNEAFGGPMLMRIPASALKDLAAFGSQLAARGYKYNSVAVRIGFDIEASYPKPTFRAIRPLNDEEATKVVELYNSDLVERVLADFESVKTEPETPRVEATFEEEPVPVAPPSKPAARVPAPPPARAAAPAATAAPPKKTVSFGNGKAAPPKAVVNKAIPAPSVETVQASAPTEPSPSEETAAPGSIDDDIRSILTELNSTS